jgi:hypothetical protein
MWNRLRKKKIPLALEPNKRLLQHLENFSKLEEAYPISKTDEPTDLHVPRSLDESYYIGLDSTYTRDCDQVVYRYTKERAKKEARKQDSLIARTLARESMK